MGPLPALGCAAVVVLASIGGACALSRSARKKARAAALIKRYGTTDTDAIAALADTYYKLCETQEATQADVSAKTATADALYASLSSNEQGILLEVRRFAPSAFDIPPRMRPSRERSPAGGSSPVRRPLPGETRLRYEVLAQQSPALSEEQSPLTAPARERASVEQDLETVRGELAAARSRSRSALRPAQRPG